MSKQYHLTTYPQMLPGEKGEGWTVISGGIRALMGKSDLEGKLLVIPDGAEVEERNIRGWELAAARWSPHQSLGVLAERNGVSGEALEMAERFRLTFNLKKASPSLFAGQFSKGTLDPEVVEAYAESLRVDSAEEMRSFPLVVALVGQTEGANRLIGKLQTRARVLGAQKGDIPELLARGLRDALRSVRNIQEKGKEIMTAQLRRSYPAFPRSITFAKYLQEEQERQEAQAKGLREQITQSRTQRGAAGKELRDLKKDGEVPGKGKVPLLVSKFGKMSIRIPPLVMPLKAKNKIARHRVTEEGVLPFQLYRLHTDGKVFLDPRKTRGGTVVVDISASMGLSPEQVYEFVLQCPGATIAQYSGSGNSGELVVVAHKGRIAPRDVIGVGRGGNIVDGPALEWLGRQPAPRVWVSDTRVTGVGDAGGRELRDLCMDQVRKAQIKIVEEFDPWAVTKALHASSRRLLAKAKKNNPYE